MPKTKLTLEHKEAIWRLADKGVNCVKIHRLLQEAKTIPSDVSYQSVLRAVARHKRTKLTDIKKDISEAKMIATMNDLCVVMTRILVNFEKDYNESPDTLEVGVDDRNKPYFIQPKKDAKAALNTLVRSFTELLKTPAMKGTEINIGLQNLQQAYENVVKKNEPIPVGVAVRADS